MLEQTDATTNEILEPVTFVLTYPTAHLFKKKLWNRCTNVRY